MKMYCMSHDRETAIGLKLTGIESVIVQKDKIEAQIGKVLQDENIGILVITNPVYEFAKQKFDEIQQKRKIPLIVKI